jgi:uncharacterized membrane protein YfcA
LQSGFTLNRLQVGISIVGVCSVSPLVQLMSLDVLMVLCTLLGIGGGELMGPLLYSLRVLPQVVSATTSTMSFINTSSNLVHYALLGQIKPGEFIIFSAVGAVGGVSGRTFYLYASRKYGRPSITIFMLLVVLFASFWLLVAHLSTANVDFSHFGTSC